MDEIKEKNQQNNGNPTPQNGGNGGAGGRRRRRKKRGGNHGQNNQNQNAQPAQQSKQATQSNSNQPQKQSVPNNQNNGNTNAGGKKNKNKHAQKQNQAGGNKPTPQKQDAEKKDENRKDTYVYTLDGNLYINLTNKCSNGCDFCVRNERASYYGNYLWLRHGDPTVDKVISALKGMGDLGRFKEAVFCGFGEPTYKVAEMVALCDYFHEKGISTRLNTNGQGNLINKRDIVPDLKGKIDLVNVSLNASCVEKYQPICRSQFGESGFNGMIEFAKLCHKNEINCRFSIVDCIGEEEVEACKRLAESVKIPLYIRKYITDS
ncbi:MAG: radical SAM protein [Clostridia bacterium]|nr:radical SAM protein [Clostridia bacterium]